MIYLTTNERKIQLLFMLSETNSQDGSVEGQEVTASVFTHVHLMLVLYRGTTLALSIWWDREGKIRLKNC